MKKTISFLFVPLFLFLQVFSQDVQLKYSNEITTDGLKKHLSILASKEMEGRKSGTFGQRKAAEYIARQFKETGLLTPPNLSGYTQYFTFQSTGYLPNSFSIGKNHFQVGDEYLPIDDDGYRESGFKAEEIIFAGYGITDENYDDYANKNIAGKVVIIFPGEPKAHGNFLVSGTEQFSKWGKNISPKIALAEEKGAKAVLVVNPSNDIFLSSAAAMPDKEGIPSKPLITVVRIIPQMLEKIFEKTEVENIMELYAHLAALSTTTLETNHKIKLDYRNQEMLVTSSNIIGMIEGTDKKHEYVVLSAHYDHMGIEGRNIFFGADDNGSGTSALLQMAESFMQAKKEGNGPRRSILFVAFSGEEQGLHGSSHFTLVPIIPLDSVSVNLNSDMVGRWDTNRNEEYIYVVGDNQISSELKPLSKKVNKKYTGLQLDYRYNNPGDKEMLFYRSDHINFARKGVPVIFFTNGVHVDYHKPGDTVDKIDFDLLKKRVQFIFLTAWEIANRENMLLRDIPLRPMTRLF